MKTLFLLSILLCASISFSFSQTSKGSKFWMLGGGYGHSKKVSDSYDKITNPTISSRTELFDSYSINANFGKFIRDNICQGFEGGYSYLNIEAYYPSDTIIIRNNTLQNEKVLNVKYFIRKFIPIFPQLYAFGEFNGGLSHRIDTNSQNNRDYQSKNTSINLGLKLGVRYTSKKSFFVDATTDIASAYYALGSDNNSKSTYFGIYGIPQFNQFRIGLGRTF
jgi:hypothetical protein